MNPFVADLVLQALTELSPESLCLMRADWDRLPSHVAVLDHNGFIVATNIAWDKFALDNSQTLSPGRPTSWVGTNYLEAAAQGLAADDEAHQAHNGLRAVLSGELGALSLSYPCHSPDQQRWFSMTVTPLQWQGRRGALVAHTNSTPCHRLCWPVTKSSA